MNNTFVPLLKLARVHNFPDLDPLPLPEYKTSGSSGMDLCADVGPEGFDMKPGARYRCPTGIKMEITGGCEGQIRARSGLAFQHGITVVNAPGTIDSDYRGEILVSLVNLGDQSYRIKRGERVAQLIIAPVTRVEVMEVKESELTETHRGVGGFGSTGTGVASEEKLKTALAEGKKLRDEASAHPLKR